MSHLLHTCQCIELGVIASSIASYITMIIIPSVFTGMVIEKWVCFFLLIFLDLFYRSSASHFRGGIIQWRPLDAQNFNGMVREGEKGREGKERREGELEEGRREKGGERGGILFSLCVHYEDPHLKGDILLCVHNISYCYLKRFL